MSSFYLFYYIFKDNLKNVALIRIAKHVHTHIKKWLFRILDSDQFHVLYYSTVSFFLDNKTEKYS